MSKTTADAANSSNAAKPWLKHYAKGIPAEIDLSPYSSILDVVDRACQKFPDHPAFSNLGHTISFSEMNRLSYRFAAYLQSVGLQKGDRIALQMPNILQYPICLYGALRAGLTIVNTNPLYTEREMEHQFKDSGTKAIVILANFAHNLEKILEHTEIEHVIITEVADLLPLPKRLLINSVIKYVKKMIPSYEIKGAITFNAALDQGAQHRLKPVAHSLDDIAFLQYTGGTTGVAKGAMLTHKNMVANMEQIRVWIQPLLVEGKEIAVMPLPMYHIFCMTVNGMAILSYGAHHIMITNPKDLPSMIQDLKKYPFTVMTGVNTLFNALNHNEEFQKLDFSSLKISVAGGMALQTVVGKKWQEITGSPVVEGWGLTETSPVACVNSVDGTDRPGTIGVPIPSTIVKILDDAEKEVPQGEIGELCVYGPQVMKGYWKRDDETAKVMSKDGGLKTGDLGFMDADGFFKIVDRKKDMILVSGFNVYPNEVEDVIALHPKVKEVAAIGIPDEHSGEVVKVFVVKKDESLTSEEVVKYARESLVGYKVPRQVEFRSDLPKSNVGKILRKELRAPVK